jgi:hypothetical protein
MYARASSIWLAVWIQPVARPSNGSEGIQLSGIHLEAVPQRIMSMFVASILEKKKRAAKRRVLCMREFPALWSRKSMVGTLFLLHTNTTSLLYSTSAFPRSRMVKGLTVCVRTLPPPLGFHFLVVQENI